MQRILFILLPIYFCATLYVSYAQSDTNTVSSATDATTSTFSITPNTTTVAPDISCESHHNDCKACVQNSKCYFCGENNQCHTHVEKAIVDGQCNMKNAYFYTCTITFRNLMIIAGVLCGIPVLIILVLCCYCCCCKKRGIKLSKDDLKWARQREERQQIAAERRKERAERTEEIRKKYGLVRDSNPYQKFDA
jgi:hypothetical protein